MLAENFATLFFQKQKLSIEIFIKSMEMGMDIY